MSEIRLPVGPLGKQIAQRRLDDLWGRCALKSKAGNAQRLPEMPTLGPRSFALWPSAEVVFYCDPDAPLKHMQTVVVMHRREPCFWAYVKTKRPDKAKVLQIGWPGRSAGMRYRRKDEAEGWQIASVVIIGRLSQPHVGEEAGREVTSSGAGARS